MADDGELITLIVDGANVMGSRPDGWWRDRAGAMVRLHDELAALAARGVTGVPPEDDGPAVAGSGPRPATDGAAPPVSTGEEHRGRRWFPRFVLVVEGQAKAAASRVTGDSRVRVVAAPGSGDDEIALLAGSVPGRCLVVTADRELRQRCLAAGAGILGPRWLTALLSAPA